MTLIAATIPNSTNKPDPVNANTPKPMDVVKLAKNNVLPILDVLSIKDSSLLLVRKKVSWYLFNKNITLGTPMTTIKGGMRPESSVILKSNKTMVASEATIPTRITIKAKKTTLMDLKK
jgi:hypothetical protein